MMNHKTSIHRFLRAGRLVALSLVAPFAIGFAQDSTSYIYLESNAGQTPNQNAILAYSNDGAGNLTPVAGSPFLMGGTGVVDATSGPTEFDADQEVIASGDGSLLYAVNGHSNSISGFSINNDGSLTAVPGSPFPSGGQNPVSLGLSANPGPDTLVAVNKNEDPNQDNSGTVPNYTTFAVNTDGSLTGPVSTFDVAAGSSPSQALTSAKGHLLFGIEFLSSRLSSYMITKSQTIQPVSSIGTPNGSGDHFLGGTINPKTKTIYVGLPVGDFVGVYRYNSAGVLTFSRVISNPGHLVCWLTTNASGTFLFTSETGTGSVSSYSLANPLRPLLVQHFILSGTSQAPSNIALDPSEKFLYVLAGHNLHVLNVGTDGTMTETTAPTVLPVGDADTPLGLAVVAK